MWKALRESGSGRERRRGARRGKAEVSGAAAGTHGRNAGQPPRSARRAPPACPPSPALFFLSSFFSSPPRRRHHGGQGPLADLGHHLLPVHRGGDLRGAGGAALALGHRRLQAAEDGAAQAVSLPGPGGARQDSAGTGLAAGRQQVPPGAPGRERDRERERVREQGRGSAGLAGESQRRSRPRRARSRPEESSEPRGPAIGARREPPVRCQPSTEVIAAAFAPPGGAPSCLRRER